MIKRYLAGITVLLLFIAGVLLVTPVRLSGDSVESRVFCAYGKVFVEFDDGKYKWGTMMLDSDGLPIDCKKYIEPENKESRYYGT
jgi:hypothetical protein